jgi:hypothetical protein
MYADADIVPRIVAEVIAAVHKLKWGWLCFGTGLRTARSSTRWTVWSLARKQAARPCMALVLPARGVPANSTTSRQERESPPPPEPRPMRLGGSDVFKSRIG